jgi:hypothetical protein
MPISTTTNGARFSAVLTGLTEPTFGVGAILRSRRWRRSYARRDEAVLDPGAADSPAAGPAVESRVADPVEPDSPAPDVDLRPLVPTVICSVDVTMLPP